MTVRLAFVVCLGLATAGCGVFRGSPVPPPPPQPEASDVVGIGGQTVLEQIERDAAGAIVGFEPLTRARETLVGAQTDEAVVEHGEDELTKAQTALAAAESAWRDIAEAPAKRPETLAAIAHDSHRAQRWAEIAEALAARETALTEIERVRIALARREAEDERWLGVELVPDMYGEIHFAVGTTDIAPDAGPVIEQIVEFLKIHPRYAVEVRGHSDNSPPSPDSLRRFLRAHPDVAEEIEDVDARVAAFNRAVSLRRARAVVAVLAAEGIDESRLSARGLGAGHPVADNDTAAGRRENRRVEVLVVPALGWAGDYADGAGKG